MSHLTDLDKERKKHVLRHTVKRLLVLALLSAVVFVAYAFRFDLASQGIGVLLTDTLQSAFDNHGYPVVLATPPLQLVHVGRRVAALSPTGVSVYNPAGHEVDFARLTSTMPVAVTAGRWLMVYDQGGYGISIRSGSQQLFEDTCAGVIYAATLCERGLSAVSTAAVGCQSQVTVLDAEYQKLFEWASSEGLVSVLSLNDHGELCAMGGVQSDKGVISSSVRLFSLSGGVERWNTIFTDEVLLAMRVQNDGSVVAVTDRAVVALSPDGVVRNRTDYGDEQLDAFCIAPDGTTAIAVGSYAVSHHLTLRRLDPEARQVASVMLTEPVQSLFFHHDDVIAFQGNRATRYSAALELRNTIETPDAACAAVVGDDLYHATARELRRSPIR
ncbi:MAG: DUF5711 family protein [Oscillospiraceae bacterium]